MLKKTLIASLVIVLWPLHGQAAGSPMKPGKWSIDTSTTMPMMAQPMDFTVTQCITKSQLEPQDMVTDVKNCTVSNTKVVGPTVSWDVVCSSGGGKFSGSGSVTSFAESYNGEMTMTMSMNGRTMTMQTRWKGKYLGACDAK